MGHFEPQSVSHVSHASDASRALAPPAAPLALPDWKLPGQGLTVYHADGHSNAPSVKLPRLAHYFLPHLLLGARPVLYLDGANTFDPLLLARFARSRGLEPSEFNRHIRVARAFTCFQLTELVERLPRLLRQFPARVAMVTALPELYFDEDVVEADARASFHRALEAVRRVSTDTGFALAVFTDAGGFASPRGRYFKQLTDASDRVMRFAFDGDRPTLTCEKDTHRLSA